MEIQEVEEAILILERHCAENEVLLGALSHFTKCLFSFLVRQQ